MQVPMQLDHSCLKVLQHWKYVLHQHLHSLPCQTLACVSLHDSNQGESMQGLSITNAYIQVWCLLHSKTWRRTHQICRACYSWRCLPLSLQASAQSPCTTCSNQLCQSHQSNSPPLSCTWSWGGHSVGSSLPNVVLPAQKHQRSPFGPLLYWAYPPLPAPSLCETLLHNNAPVGTVDDVNSFWCEGVETMPWPNLNNTPNYKEGHLPKILSTSATSGRPQKSVAPLPKWYNALPETSMHHAKLNVGQLFGVLTLLPIINLLRHLASHASGEIMPLYDSTHPLQVVSITVSRLGGDVPMEWLELLG